MYRSFHNSILPFIINFPDSRYVPKHLSGEMGGIISVHDSPRPRSENPVFWKDYAAKKGFPFKYNFVPKYFCFQMPRSELSSISGILLIQEIWFYESICTNPGRAHEILLILLFALRVAASLQQPPLHKRVRRRQVILGSPSIGVHAVKGQ